MHGEDVGARVKQLRKLRGLTQYQLAAGTHFSVSLIKKVEQGIVPASPALVAVVARTLKIKPAYLYGTQARELEEQPRVEAAGIAGLRAALDSYDDPRPEGPPLDLARARDRVDHLASLVQRLRYDQAVVELPDTLNHLYVLAAVPGVAGERGRAFLHDGYRLAASLASQYQQADLAAIASERHIMIAAQTGDPLRVAVSAYHRSTRHLNSGEFDRGVRMLDRALQHIETGPAASAVAIQLHLRCAILSARAGQRDRADERVGEARRIHDDFQPLDRPYFNIDASRLNIDVHWCAVPVEDYDGSTAIHRASQVTVTDGARPERVAHHYIDLARAWLLHGGRDRTMSCLNRARQIAPDRIRHHPSVRTTVMALAASDRTATQSLARFARWADVPI